jgi:hypothetical protein
MSLSIALVLQGLCILFYLLASSDINMSVFPFPGSLLVDMVYKGMSSGGIWKTSTMK